MFITRHRALRWAAKAILTVICFSLFTAQASYKFYQFASTRALYGLNKTIASRSATAVVKDVAHDRCTAYSLDKRFDLSPFFLLPAPAAGVITLLVARPAHSSLPPACVIDGTGNTTLMRGPPATRQ